MGRTKRPRMTTVTFDLRRIVWADEDAKRTARRMFAKLNGGYNFTDGAIPAHGVLVGLRNGTSGLTGRGTAYLRVRRMAAPTPETLTEVEEHEEVHFIIDFGTGLLGLSPVELRTRVLTNRSAQRRAMRLIQKAMADVLDLKVGFEVPKGTLERADFQTKLLEVASDPTHQRVQFVEVVNIGDYELPAGFTILNPNPDDEEVLDRAFRKREAPNVKRMQVRAKEGGDLSHSPSVRFAVGSGDPRQLVYSERRGDDEQSGTRTRRMLINQSDRASLRVEREVAEDPTLVAERLPELAEEIHGWERFTDADSE